MKVENFRMRRQAERMRINDTIDCQSIDEKSLFMTCYIKWYRWYSRFFRALHVVCMTILHKNLMKNAWNMQHCRRRRRHLKVVINAKMGCYANLSFFSMPTNLSGRIITKMKLRIRYSVFNCRNLYKYVLIRFLFRKWKKKFISFNCKFYISYITFLLIRYSFVIYLLYFS